MVWRRGTDTDWITFTQRWKWKELNQGDVRGRHSGMVLKIIWNWKDLVCPWRMHSI